MNEYLRNYWLRVVLIIILFGVYVYFFGPEEGKLPYYVSTLIATFAFVLTLSLPFAIEEYFKTGEQKRISKNELRFLILLYVISLVLISFVVSLKLAIIFVSVSFLGYAVIFVLNYLIHKLDNRKNPSNK